MSGVTHPIAWSTLVDYWSGELALDAQDSLEEHLMGCATCTDLSARVQRLTQALHGLIPPLLTETMLSALAGRGARVVENSLRPGERREVVFPAGADILLHRLVGLELEAATRVSFELRVEGTDRVLLSVEDAPYEREQGSVLVACQRHFASMPPDNVAEVRVVNAAGEEQISTYTILHRFEAREAERGR
jgi:hypothetical protein